MGVLHVKHPDILEFITSKRDPTKLNTFNTSVAATEEFMKAVINDDDYQTISPRTAKPVESLKAREVFELTVSTAWEGGDPGIVFIDRINKDNPTPHIGEIESTNPCGEQPFLPYEACILGSSISPTWSKTERWTSRSFAPSCGPPFISLTTP